MRLTANQLITAVNRRCGWASTNGPLADATASETHETALLAIADEELQGDAYPLVMSTDGGYYAVKKDYTIVAGQRLYRLPPYAHNAVKDVVWVDGNGVEFPLSVVDSEDVPRLAYAVTNGTVQNCVYYLDNDFLALHPAPTSTTGTLRLKYYRQPGQLALSTGTRVVSISSASWASSVQTIVVADTTHYYPTTSDTGDIVGAGNAHASILIDATIATRVSTTYTLTATDNPGVVAGDWFCQPGYSAVVQLPDHMQPYFIRRVAGACLTVTGDLRAAGVELDAAAQLYEKAQSTSKPRDQAEPKALITRNSPLRVRSGGGLSWSR